MQFMKKALVLSILLLPGLAGAANFNNKAFVGLGYTYNLMDRKVDRVSTAQFTNGIFTGSISGVPKDKLNGVDVHVGYRWKALGLQIGYTYLQEVNYTRITLGMLDQDNYNIYADALYFYSLDRNFDVKGLLGIGQLHTKYSRVMSNVPTNSKEVKPRAGIGLAINAQENWSVDMMYIWQGGNDVYSSMSSFGVGINFHF